MATTADAGNITHLLQASPYKHIHADWNLPADWLGTPGFVVLPKPHSSFFLNGMFGGRSQLLACLAVTADPPPAAWVRVAAINGVQHPKLALAAMLERVKEYLRQTAVTKLAWLVMNAWPEEWLPQLGFVCVNEVETYLKGDLNLPAVAPVPDLQIRPARPEDMETLARIESAAHDPLWQYSAGSLALARRHALSFDVAILNQKIAGFQLSDHNDHTAHLVRLTISPDLHRQGIGSAILAHAIEGYRHNRLRGVSLNTQVDNIASHYLYRKFGFSTGDWRMPVWVLTL